MCILKQGILQFAISKSDYKAVPDEFYRLREVKQNIQSVNAEHKRKRQRIAEMEEFLCKQECRMEEYDEHLVRKLIEKITVFEDKLTIELKSCVEIDIVILGRKDYHQESYVKKNKSC